MAIVVCSQCQTVAAPLDWRCQACGGVLEYDSLPPFDPDRILRHETTLWRYQHMLPVARRASLGEGMTPLSAAALPLGDAWLKQEYLNPTGSYKDRGTALLMNHLAAQGVREVVEDSSGNAGASCAAYAAALGIHAKIYVPTRAYPAKKALIEAFGAELVEIDGDQQAKTDACMEAAAHTPYASHAWCPQFVVGQMTAAYELWEQMQGRVPDAIVTPLGHGTLFLGFALGFRKLYAEGYVDKLPRMYGVQAYASDPLVRAYEQGREEYVPMDSQATIADGIIVPIPYRGRIVLENIYHSGGAALRVTDTETAAAQAELWRHGYIVEPTSATTYAALPQVRAHLGKTNAVIVLGLTGNGLKNVGR